MISQEETMSSYVPGYPIIQESSFCSLCAGVTKSCWHVYSTCFSMVTCTYNPRPSQRSCLMKSYSVKVFLILGRMGPFPVDNNSTALSCRPFPWYNLLFHIVTGFCFLFVWFLLFFFSLSTRLCLLKEQEIGICHMSNLVSGIILDKEKLYNAHHLCHSLGIIAARSCLG